MEGSRLSYLFLELAFAGGLLTLFGPLLRWRGIRWRPVAALFGALFLLWIMVDLIALALELWTFPPEGTLQVRILGLPLEELLVFHIHSLACLLLVLMLKEPR